MSEQIQAHVFANGTCRYCGGLETGLQPGSEMTCILRENPNGSSRATPSSVVSDFDGIHEHLKRIRAEEDAALAGIVQAEADAAGI